jgi:hypothetical protein
LEAAGSEAGRSGIDGGSWARLDCGSRVAAGQTDARRRLPRSVAACRSYAGTTRHTSAGAACFGGLCVPAHPYGTRRPFRLPDRRHHTLTQPKWPQTNAKAEPDIHTMRSERPDAGDNGFSTERSARPSAANRRPPGRASSASRSSVRAVLGLVKGARARRGRRPPGPGRGQDLLEPSAEAMRSSLCGLIPHKDERVVPGPADRVPAAPGPAGTAHATLTQPQPRPRPRPPTAAHPAPRAAASGPAGNYRQHARGCERRRLSRGPMRALGAPTEAAPRNHPHIGDSSQSRGSAAAAYVGTEFAAAWHPDPARSMPHQPAPGRHRRPRTATELRTQGR